MFKDSAPKPDDLCTVPPAQQPGRHNAVAEIEKHVNFTKAVNAGVTNILTGRRGFAISHKSKLDLCHCMNLLESKEDLDCDWDFSFFASPSRLKSPRLATEKVGKLAGDKQYDEPSDDDDIDYDPIERPEWTMGEVHIVAMPKSPYWTLARFASNVFWFFLVFFLFFW